MQSDLIQYWDSVAAVKKFSTPNQLEEIEKRVDKNSPILDLGCGYGRSLDKLVEAGYSNLFGIDYSQKMIELAKEHLPKFVDFRVASASELPYEDESFKGVILFSILTCIIDPNIEHKVFAEVRRILMPG